MPSNGRSDVDAAQNGKQEGVRSGGKVAQPPQVGHINAEKNQASQKTKHKRKHEPTKTPTPADGHKKDKSEEKQRTASNPEDADMESLQDDKNNQPKESEEQEQLHASKGTLKVEESQANC